MTDFYIVMLHENLNGHRKEIPSLSLLSVDVASPKILKKINQTTDGCSFKLKEFGAGVQNIVLFRDILIKN